MLGDAEVPQEGVACAERKHGDLAFLGDTGIHESVDQLGGGPVTPNREKAPASVCRCCPRELRSVPWRFGERDVQLYSALLQRP